MLTRGGGLMVGVDPGKQGGIAEIERGVPALLAMPLVPARKGVGDYDLGAIARLVEGWRERHAFVTVERLDALPPRLGGSKANHARGQALGWAWALSAAGVAFQLVRPQTWQRVMLAGVAGSDTKQRAIIAAQRLFPGVDLRQTPRCRVAHDGYADALLLASYGQRTLAGAAA